MPITAKQRNLMDLKLQELDYQSGGGVFKIEKREVTPGSRFLIISYGGTGADALLQVRDTLKKNMVTEDMDRCVKIICIDTDLSTKTTSKEVIDEQGNKVSENVERFSSNEFFWLDGNVARNKLENQPSLFEAWINPTLRDIILANKTYLDGKGASSTRQVGRVMLTPESVYTALFSKVSAAVKALTAGNDDALDVMIISGISGGTGSGIVVDATYMIRDIITQVLPVGKNVQYRGFLLLPPTGTSDEPVDITKGNSNGYAALKEIDYFMTIADRGEEYRAEFEARAIVSKDSIFSSCYLIDGVAGSVAAKNPRAKAKETLANTLLDTLTNRNTKSQNNALGTQGMGSILSDSFAAANAIVSKKVTSICPREANYKYNAIGNGKIIIPTQLMKTYVANIFFNEMYGLFNYCSNVTDAAAAAFVKDLVDDNQIKADGGVQRHIGVRIDRCCTEINPSAKVGGPFYAINLLRAAVKYIDGVALPKETGRLLKNNNLISNLQTAKNMCLYANNSFFEIFTTVMEQVKDIVKKEAGIISDSELQRDFYGTSYSFTPIELNGTDNQAKVVDVYLRSLINPNVVVDLVKKLINDVVANRNQWTQLELGGAPIPGQAAKPAFDAPNRIRMFLDHNIGKIVDSTVEDYLIKYYSGNSNAKYEEMPGTKDPTPQCDAALKKAAQAIVNELTGPAGSAVPVVQLQTFQNEINQRGFLLVPENAPHLYKYIEEYIDAMSFSGMISVEAILSTSHDSISAFTLYTGIPAFLLTWASRAEPAYEADIKTARAGLHMSETAGGRLWMNFPNLLKKPVWDKIGVLNYSNRRELDIIGKAENVFDRARSLGLAESSVVAVGNSNVQYTVFALDSQYRPADELFKAVDIEMADTPVKAIAVKNLEDSVEACAKKLFEKQDWKSAPAINMNEMKLKLSELLGASAFTGTLLKSTSGADTPGPDENTEGICETIAQSLLRERPLLLDKMRGTVLVLEKVFAMISKAQAHPRMVMEFAELLAGGMFYPEEYTGFWYYNGFMKPEVLFAADFGNKVQETAEYYYMFNKYKEMNIDTVDKLIFDYEAAYTFTAFEQQNDPLAARNKQIEISKKAQPIVEIINKRVKFDKTNPNQMELLVSAQFNAAAKMAGVSDNELNDIISFYQDLANAMSNIVSGTKRDTHRESALK